MNEHQRMQYLSALDIDSYMPRFFLPNAPETVTCQLSVVENNIAEAVVDVPIEGGGSTSPAVTTSEAKQAASDVLAILGASKVKTVVKEAKPVVADKPQVSDQPIIESKAIEPFSLSLWVVGDVMVLDSRNSDMPLPTDRLFNNMIAALGYSRADLQSAEILNWPFNLLDTAERTEQGARIDLQAFLDGKLLTSKVTSLYIFGEVAAKYILPSDMLFTHCLNKKVSLIELSCEAFVTYSLSEFLSEPELKQQFWQLLGGYRKNG